MKKRLVFAALGLAVAAFAFGPKAAQADHCRSGRSFSGYRGGIGIGIGRSYRISPRSNYGYRGSHRHFRGHHHHHHHGLRGHRGFYGRSRYGSSFYLRTPRFSFGIRR